MKNPILVDENLVTKIQKIVNFSKEFEKNAQKSSEYKYVYSVELYFLIFLFMYICLYFLL